ncbi:F0F1 ATP synthase subunit epsilon [Syntrophotalea acetylenivorans]|uniref:F0F1 ATP synthase subunit epsilon n=1 Tax=Syntrophotalea acetylenivorans TaxID=1842532 RepID=A0A1L3GQ28_9BACT|nr:F0F1 ATP synthase subunit epsilon [Syntrophotalea acetylenivorans]APG27970.1 F0F1 ATP synthase subunit epsilon [Syntrophotalea acetylenivorans]
MNLKVLIPTEVLLEREISSLTAEGQNGSFCLRPRHIDFVAPLVAGLLYFVEQQEGVEGFVAIDQGVLVKYGAQVTVSVRNAVFGPSLEDLLNIVDERFGVLDDQQRMVRSAMTRLEADFLRRFMELK